MPSVRTRAAIIVCPPSSQQGASDTSPIRLGRSATPALDARHAQRRSQPGLSDDEPTVVPSLDARRTPLTCRAEPLPLCDPNRRTGYDPCRMTYVGYAEVMRWAIRNERRGCPTRCDPYTQVSGEPPSDTYSATDRLGGRKSGTLRAPGLVDSPGPVGREVPTARGSDSAGGAIGMLRQATRFLTVAGAPGAGAARRSCHLVTTRNVGVAYAARAIGGSPRLFRMAVGDPQ